MQQLRFSLSIYKIYSGLMVKWIFQVTFDFVDLKFDVALQITKIIKIVYHCFINERTTTMSMYFVQWIVNVSRTILLCPFAHAINNWINVQHPTDWSESSNPCITKRSHSQRCVSSTELLKYLLRQLIKKRRKTSFTEWSFVWR